MTLDEFKARLTAEHAGQFNLSQGGYIRHKTIKIKWAGPEISACPLAAMFGQNYFSKADDAGMSYSDQSIIVMSADVRFSSTLRSWMLATLCGETT